MTKTPVKKRYGNYNPFLVYVNNYHQTTLEEQIHLQYEKIAEWELRQSRFKCHYKTKTTKAGEMLEVEIYPCFLNRQDYSRAKKAERTGKAQKNHNDKVAQRKLVRYINTNFVAGDIAFVGGFTNKLQPKTLKDCKREITNFINRIKYHMDTAGLTGSELKYIYVIESKIKNGKEHFHVHFIFNDVAGANNKGEDRGKWLSSLWQGGDYPRIDYLMVKNIGGLTGISSYMTKQFEEFSETEPNKRRWGQSLNLKKYSEKPTSSFRKFNKRRVAGMLKAPATMKVIFESEYPAYNYWEDYPCEVRYSDVIDGYYLYCRMYKKRC